MFAFRKSELFAEDVSVAEIASQVGTPFYCYSRQILAERYRAFADALIGADALVAYAMKANGALGVLRVLASEGAGADIVSGGELFRARKAGVPSDKIVFSGVGKTEREMQEALEAGIRQFNVESAGELDRLEAVARSAGECAALAIRVNPDVAAGGHANISTGKLGDKFGVDFDQAAALLAHAAQSPHLKPVGFAFHIGSQIIDLSAFDEAFAKAGEFTERMRREGFDIACVDVGGGLGISSAAAPAPDIADYGARIRNFARRFDVSVICEPGRAIAGPAGVLIAKTLYVKESAGKRFLIVDAGMNDLKRPALYGAEHPITTAVQTNTTEPDDDGTSVEYDVVGPICETTDRFASAARLPQMAPGDLIALWDAGAYGAAIASEYNARPRTAEILVSGDRFSVIRRRPNYAEMTAYDTIPEWA